MLYLSGKAGGSGDGTAVMERAARFAAHAKDPRFAFPWRPGYEDPMPGPLPWTPPPSNVLELFLRQQPQPPPFPPMGGFGNMWGGAPMGGNPFAGIDFGGGMPGMPPWDMRQQQQAVLRAIEGAQQRPAPVVEPGAVEFDGE